MKSLIIVIVIVFSIVFISIEIVKTVKNEVNKNTNINEESSFIIKWMKEMSLYYKDIKLTYAFDHITRFHVIEVSPDSIESSSEFAESALDFEFDFFEKFPQSDILISEESEENDMRNVIFKIK